MKGRDEPKARWMRMLTTCSWMCEFAMAAGEMTEDEFTQFLNGAFSLMTAHSADSDLLCLHGYGSRNDHH
jgi:hypothetical protein